MDTSTILPPGEAELRVHGNGFIQAETSIGTKFHIWWGTRLPQQERLTRHHNHDHGFRSTVLYGSLFFEEFTIEEVPTWKAEYAESFYGEQVFVPHQAIPRQGKDTRLEPSGSFVGLRNRRRFCLAEGSRYDFPLNMNLFHEVIPDTNVVITHVERTGRDTTGTLPTVLVPANTEPDNRFNRYAFNKIATEVYKDAMIIIKRYF